MKFTEKQIKEIDNLNIEDRVNLARQVLWNNETYDADNEYKTTGLEDYKVSPENTEYFLKGATAMFDTAQQRAANHWHGIESINEQCNLENEFLLQTMETAFEYINPDKMDEWKDLGECLTELREIKKFL